jgi:hypothetical protein
MVISRSTEPMYFVFCRFYPFSLSHHGSVWLLPDISPVFGYSHKVLTYIEYRAMSGVFRTIDPPPQEGGGGVQTRRAVSGWGSIFWKTPDIGLASYSIIPLRLRITGAGLPIHLIGEVSWETKSGVPLSILFLYGSTVPPLSIPLAIFLCHYVFLHILILMLIHSLHLLPLYLLVLPYSICDETSLM